MREREGGERGRTLAKARNSRFRKWRKNTISSEYYSHLKKRKAYLLLFVWHRKKSKHEKEWVCCARFRVGVLFAGNQVDSTLASTRMTSQHFTHLTLIISSIHRYLRNFTTIIPILDSIMLTLWYWSCTSVSPDF